jgi:hypothetical protein
MKLSHTKEWYEKRINLEGDREVEAGNVDIMKGLTKKPYSYQAKRGHRLLDFWLGCKYEIILDDLPIGITVSDLYDAQRIVGMLNGAYAIGWSQAYLDLNK